jgi:hypothetical protein
MNLTFIMAAAAVAGIFATAAIKIFGSRNQELCMERFNTNNKEILVMKQQFADMKDHMEKQLEDICDKLRTMDEKIDRMFLLIPKRNDNHFKDTK